MSRAGHRPASLPACFASAAMAMQLSACVSTPPPRSFDLAGAELVVVDAPPRLDVSGLAGGKVAGAGVGAGTGTGAGALLAGAACVAAGPLIGVCIAALLPAVSVAGAVTGGVIGAVKTESVEALDRKARALQGELTATSYQSALVEQLQSELRAMRAVSVPLTPASGGVAAASHERGSESKPWTVHVALTDVGTEGKSEFAIRMVARASLNRKGETGAVWTVAKEVQSETELTTSAWLFADAHALRTVLQRCVRQAAHELAIDLTRPVDGRALAPHPRSPRSASCHDDPDEMVKLVAD